MPRFVWTFFRGFPALGWLILPLAGQEPAGQRFDVSAPLALTQESASQAWGEKETRLAGIYLEALQAEPTHGHMLHSLWQLYQKHGATADLLESMRAQAEGADGSPVARLIHGHLLRQNGDLPAAAAVYEALLAEADAAAASGKGPLADGQGKPLQSLARRARAELAVQTGDEVTAITLYEKLAQSLADDDPEKIPLLVELGQRHAAAQNPQFAWGAWQRALQLAAYEPVLMQNIAQRLLAAGKTAECLALYERLAADPLPERRFAALEEMGRLYELQEDFAKASAALVQSQAMTHFRDARYVELLRRRVLLGERFDKLAELEKELVTAARALPPEEKALLDAARFFSLTVQPEQRLAWLRPLVSLVPANADYRGDLIDSLLQLDGEAEAAAMLDALLAQPGQDAFAQVQKRAELEARQGQLAAAEARLRRWLAARPRDSTAASQVLNHARLHRLDALAEEILRQNQAREPGETAPVLELAGFLLERNRPDEALKALHQWMADASPDAKASRERGQRAALFLSGRGRRDMAEAFARKALQTDGAGTAESLLLAEVMFRENKVSEAIAACERAWALAQDDSQRREADEKLLAILSGNQPPPPPAAPPASAAPLGGFGQSLAQENPPSLREAIPLPVRDYARHLVEKAEAGAPSRINADVLQLFRAAWWSARAREDEAAFRCLESLRESAAEARTPLPAPAEKLWLELAEATQNHALAQRQIAVMLTLDPANRDDYERRLAISLIAGGERERGETLLRGLHRRQPGSTPIAEALIRSYRDSGRLHEAIALWEEMLRAATPAAARQLLRPYARALVEANRRAEAFAAYQKVIPLEKDPRSRLELLEEQLRFLPPPGDDPGAGAHSPASAPAELEAALKSYAALASAHPFEPFYREALARLHEMRGDPLAAFAELRRGYYLSRSPGENLPRLRAAAVKAEDQEAAVYFQKQILAQNPAQHGESEWRTLIELLENNFRTDEADATRRRMERRFSRDADILERIARHYEEAQQFTDALRLRKALVLFRKGDLATLWACVRLELNEGDPAVAESLLDEVLLLTQNAAEPHRADDDRMPFPPLLLGLEDQMQNRDDWRRWAETITSSTSQEENIQIGPLTAWLNLPHAYLEEDSLEGYAIRLHALKAQAKLIAARGGADLAAWIARWKANDRAAGTVSMRLWALGYAGAKTEMLNVLAAHTEGHEDVRTRFLFALLALTNGVGVEASADSVVGVKPLGESGGVDSPLPESPKVFRLTESAKASTPTPAPAPASGDNPNARADFLAFQQAMSCLQQSGYQLPMETLVSLVKNPRLPLENATLLVFPMANQPFSQWQAAAEALIKRSESSRPYVLLELSRAARQAGLWMEEESCLSQYFDWQLTPGIPALNNPWDIFYLIDRYLRLLPVYARHAFCQRAEAWVKSLPASRENAVLRADLAEWQANIAEAERLAWAGVSSFYNPRARPASNPNEVFTESDSSGDVSRSPHQALWREADKALNHLSPGLALKTGRRMEEEFGPLYHGPNECAEYTLFHLNQLTRELDDARQPERLHLTRQALARTPSAEAALNLALHLEMLHYKREAILVLEDLTFRAPANSQYAETLLKLCRESGDTDTGLRYLERLFTGEIPQPPPGLSDEEIYRAHAVFLRLTDPGQLAAAAHLHPVPAPKTDPWPRPPADIHYLRELIDMILADNHEEEAVREMERLSSFLPADGDLCEQLSDLLEETGRQTDALALWREKLANKSLNEKSKPILRLRLFFYLLQAGERKQALALLPNFMRNVNDFSSSRILLGATDALRQHQDYAEARALLASALRQSKDKHIKLDYGACLLMTEIESSQGDLHVSYSTLNLLLRMDHIEFKTDANAFIEALQALPAHQFPAWIEFFRRYARTPAHAPLAVLGLVLLTDRPEELPVLVQSLLARRPQDDSIRYKLWQALNTVMNAGQWEKSKILLDAVSSREEDPLRWLVPRLRYAKALNDALMRQEEMRNVELTEDINSLENLMSDNRYYLTDPGFSAQLARRLIEQTPPELQASPKTELYLRVLLDVGDVTAARQLLQSQLRILTPEAAVKALLDVAEASGRLATFEQDLAGYQVTSGIRAAALRAWRRK